MPSRGPRETAQRETRSQSPAMGVLASQLAASSQQRGSARPRARSGPASCHRARPRGRLRVAANGHGRGAFLPFRRKSKPQLCDSQRRSGGAACPSSSSRCRRGAQGGGPARPAHGAARPEPRLHPRGFREPRPSPHGRVRGTSAPGSAVARATARVRTPARRLSGGSRSEAPPPHPPAPGGLCTAHAPHTA